MDRIQRARELCQILFRAERMAAELTMYEDAHAIRGVRSDVEGYTVRSISDGDPKPHYGYGCQETVGRTEEGSEP